MSNPINEVVQADCFTFLANQENQSVDLVVIDPPYFIENLKKNLRGDSVRGSSKNSVFCADWDSAFDTLDNYKSWTQKYLEELHRVMKDKAQCYMFCSYHHLDWLMSLIKNNGFRYYKLLIWYKPDVMGLFPNQYGCNYEGILWFSKRGKEGRFKNHIGCSQRDVMTHHSTNARYREEAGFHPTPKPIELIRRLIKNSSDPGDLVLDCFMGSGTTAVAAKNTGRRFVGCELNPEYILICKRRLSQKNLINLLEVENYESDE